MEKCIIGKKIGMTQLFDENGNIVPVTVVEAGPCVVVQRKTTENDGYEAVQIGFGAVSDKRLTKALRGHFAKADVAAKRVLREFRLGEITLAVGDIIKADTFAPGDKVDVCGTSKGKGYAGTIKRWHNHRLKETHGSGPVHRHAGSNGACSSPSRVFKGKRLPGRTAYSPFLLDGRDRLALAWLGFCGFFLLSGALAGGLRWRYYPTPAGPPLTPMTGLMLLCQLALCLTPAAIHWKEARLWRRSRSVT